MSVALVAAALPISSLPSSHREPSQQGEHTEMAAASSISFNDDDALATLSPAPWTGERMGEMGLATRHGQARCLAAGRWRATPPWAARP
jgi:hypothetical protein